MNCLICLLFLVSSVFCNDDDVVASRRFNIRPDPSKQSTDLVWDDVKCTFTYQAMGGTNEDWEIAIFRAEEHQITCMVNRADKMTTYLVFQSFSLKVNGAKLAVGQPYNRNNEALSPIEFVEVPKKNMVKNSKEFKNEIGKVTLWAQYGELKEEL